MVFEICYHDIRNLCLLLISSQLLRFIVTGNVRALAASQPDPLAYEALPNTGRREQLVLRVDQYYYRE